MLVVFPVPKKIVMLRFRVFQSALALRSRELIDMRWKDTAMLILQLLGALITIVGLAFLLTSVAGIARRAIDDSTEAKRDVDGAPRSPQPY